MLFKKILQKVFLFGIAVLFLTFLTGTNGKVNASENNPAYQNRYIITFKQHTQTKQRDEALQMFQSKLGKKTFRKTDDRLNNHLSKINALSIEAPNSNILELRNSGVGINNIASIEPDYVAQAFSVTNDLDLSKQWGLFIIKVASVNELSAWDIATGSASIRIAVLDTGVNSTHPDLLGVVETQANFSQSSGPEDVAGHGSHVSGAIAGLGNNTIGIVGIAYGTRILNGKVLDDDGYGTYSSIASGIIWAADNGAKVINMSLGGSVHSSTLNNAIDYAIGKGAVVVAAAGNSNKSTKSYPAGYDPVVSVGATDQNDKKASFSNYGKWVDVSAPGVSIYSTVLYENYDYYSGTSMATSYVSGVIGLIWSSGLCQVPSCVTNRLFSSSDAISGTGTQFKFGRVNAYRSIMPTPTPTNTPTPTPTPTIIQKTITASSITMSYKKIFSGYSITTKVTVKDGNNMAVKSATVSINTLSPTGTTTSTSGTTNTTGVVSFIVRSSNTGTYKSTIANITKSGFTYTPIVIEQTLNVL